MCTPCGFIPNNPNGCQDIGSPHAAEDGGTRGHVADIPRSPSTLCCGVQWGSAYEMTCHTLSVHL